MWKQEPAQSFLFDHRDCARPLRYARHTIALKALRRSLYIHRAYIGHVMSGPTANLYSASMLRRDSVLCGSMP